MKERKFALEFHKSVLKSRKKIKKKQKSIFSKIVHFFDEHKKNFQKKFTTKYV